MGRLALLKVGKPDAVSYSDDFSGTSLNAKWSEHDTLADISLSVGGGVLTVTVPGGTDHDWYTGIDTAMRLYQTYTGSTDFTLEVKYTSTMTTGYQFHGLTVATDFDNGLRFDIVYDANNTQYATAATFASGTYTQAFWTDSGFTTQPYYLRLVKSGTSYTPSHSTDGSSWTSYSAVTWTGTVNKIGIIVGNAGGGSTPAYTATADSFTYTAG